MTNPVTLCNFAFSLPLAYPDQSQPILAPTLDYGFDLDEEELGRELLVPLPTRVEDQPNHRVEADEFETAYRWFCS